MLVFSGIGWGQLCDCTNTPVNDCPSGAISINQCGTDFSITQSQMLNASSGICCDELTSCSSGINYAGSNCLAYEDFDCSPTQCPAGCTSPGDDFNGSIENNMWWVFQPSESCPYTITITATNCCCKQKGRSDAVQYAIYGADNILPIGTIENYYGQNGNFTGTQTITITPLANEYVYIMLDGVNGSACDVSVSIEPSAVCSGCNVLPIELLSFTVKPKSDYNYIQWSTASETNNDRFILDYSDNGFDWIAIEVVQGAGNSTSRIDYYFEHRNVNNGINYYRLTQIDFDGTSEEFPVISVDNRNDRFIVRSINMMGQEIDESYTGLIIYQYSDGTTEKRYR